MDHHGFKPAFILILSLSTFAVRAQSPPERGTRASTGALTVTATVQSSVGVISSGDGKQEVFVANAPGSPATLARPGRLQSNGQGAVVYSFPAGPFQYELTRQIVFANAIPRPVIVVTVIPR
jgi:hypothetical protein